MVACIIELSQHCPFSSSTTTKASIRSSWCHWGSPIITQTKERASKGHTQPAGLMFDPSGLGDHLNLAKVCIHDYNACLFHDKHIQDGDMIGCSSSTFVWRYRLQMWWFVYTIYSSPLTYQQSLMLRERNCSLTPCPCSQEMFCLFQLTFRFATAFVWAGGSKRE